MRVLWETHCASKYNEQIINIHHSFFPALKVPSRINKLHSYGVKVIGASARYATENHNEGPILTQDVQVSFPPAIMTRKQ